MSAEWLDISVPLSPALVQWPGDRPVRIERVSNLATGADCNLSDLSLSAHTGTHVDAPAHYLADGGGADTIPLDAVIGPARVVEIAMADSIRGADIARLRVQPGERLLFRTRNSSAAWHDAPFRTDYVYLTPEAADELVRRRVRTVGIDYLSVGAMNESGARTHRTLLQAGVCVIEGLNLVGVAPGAYELVCLPLRLVGADGAPARAVLRML